MSSIPSIRFKQFNGEWNKKVLKPFISEIKLFTSDFEKYPLFSFSIESGVTPKTERYERSYLVTKEGDTFKIISNNEFIMNPMNLRFGAINYSKIKRQVSVSGYYDIFNIDNQQANDFWLGLLRNHHALKTYNSIATGTLEEKKRVHFSQLVNLSFNIPSLEERIMISAFLDRINSKIEIQKELIEKLEQLRTALINKLVSKEHNCRIGDIITESSVRNRKTNIENVLSVSNQKGFIKQSEQFEDKDIASDDVSNYKVVEKDCYAYNPARINVGSIARYKGEEKGIVSPMYICFRVTNPDVDLTYFDNFLKSYFFKHEMFKRLEGSVRQCLTLDGMKNIPFYIPTKKEMGNFCRALDAITNKIDNERSYYDSLLSQKRWLLNGMFCK